MLQLKSQQSAQLTSTKQQRSCTLEILRSCTFVWLEVPRTSDWSHCEIISVIYNHLTQHVWPFLRQDHEISLLLHSQKMWKIWFKGTMGPAVIIECSNLNCVDFSSDFYTCITCEKFNAISGPWLRNVRSLCFVYHSFLHEVLATLSVKLRDSIITC